MIIRKLKEIRASDHNVKSDGWESARLLLADDGMGFSFHLTTLRAGSELKMHYKNHLEAVMPRCFSSTRASAISRLKSKAHSLNRTSNAFTAS